MSTDLLETRALSKSFPGVKALDSVDFSVRSGEIHALLGENGAGKSTLINVLTGVHPRDSGSVTLDGQPIDFRSPVAAERAGVATVYQEVNLIPELSVAENIMLGRQPKRLGFLRWGQIRKRADEALKRLGVDIDSTRPVSSYSMAVQQMVAISRALDLNAKLLILDEPTSSLDEQEVANLFEVMRSLRDQGLGLVFVTHFLDQVYAVSDQITVLRNGALVGTYETAELPRLELIARMLGKETAKVEGVGATLSLGGPGYPKVDALLEGKGLTLGRLGPVDLAVGRGEVVGLAGLLGSGPVTAVYAHNDDMALGAVQALEAIGRKPGVDVLVLSIDGGKAALGALVEGRLNCVVECLPLLGPDAFDAIEKLKAGKTLPKWKKVNDSLFDQSNTDAEFVKARKY